MSKEQCKECADRSSCDSDRFDTENICPYFRKKTWFDVLTSSIRKLAESFVYEIYIDDKWGNWRYYYKSTIFDKDERCAEGMICGIGAWQTREEAVEATIKRLKEEYNNRRTQEQNRIGT